MKFRKKPVEIEAIQWTGENALEVLTFIGKNGSLKNEKLQIKTLEGTMTASHGDWIIRGVKGEVYPCKNEIFEQTYDSVAN